MYLIDTNVWLERLLDQKKSEEVGQFLAQVCSDQLLISDFAFHSIGVILSRLGKHDALLRFIEDVFIDGAVILVSLQPEEIQKLVEVIDKFRLDYDDAYQYVVAEKYGAILVSFDTDFDQTEHGRKTPGELLEAE